MGNMGICKKGENCTAAPYNVKVIFPCLSQKERCKTVKFVFMDILA
tara:strand:+ start:266 stop:403 length:138 start_codon:yes stop_codon:yes gene_type:complete